MVFANIKMYYFRKIIDFLFFIGMDCIQRKAIVVLFNKKKIAPTS